jgi:outer membrane protein assembly factor BamB
MKVVVSQSISKPIILLKILDDGSLVAVDSLTTIRYLNKTTLKTKSGFKVAIEHKYYKTNVVAFSNDGKYFASVSPSTKSSLLYDVQSKKVIVNMDRHHGESSCVGIDPLARYLFSGGDDGKTFAVDIKSGKLVFTLPAHVDTITDIAFSKNSNWVATASYDRKISLLNLVTMTPKPKLKAHSAPVMKVKFFGKNKLLSIDSNSGAIIWNIYSSKVLVRLKGIHDNITQVCLSSDEQLLFMGTALGYVLLYDLNTFEQLSQRYIKITSPITAMEFDADNNYLLLGTEDGFLYSYDIYEGEERIKELLRQKDFKGIEKEIEKNPVLKFTNVYAVATNLWEHALEKAKIVLQNGDRDKALLLLNQFKDMPAKKSIINKILNDYRDYEKFTKLAKEGKYSQAYQLANIYPVYKESKIYKALEKRWKQALQLAQKYALDPKGMQKAKDLLSPYRGISEKTTFIQQVMNEGQVYKRFRDAVGQKNFKACFELIKRHPFLKEFQEYEALMKYADTLYMKVQKSIQEGDTYMAIKMLKALEDFPDFTEEVHETLKEIESRQKFFKAVKDNDLETAYNMMAIAEDLQLTDDGKKLQNMWNKDVAQANKFAAAGDVPSMKSVLEKYFKISSKYRSLATVFAWAYMNQLESALAQNREQSELENGIKNYISNFGLQDQIEAFFEEFKQKYPDSKLNLELLSKGSLAMWRPSMIVNSILE